MRPRDNQHLAYRKISVVHFGVALSSLIGDHSLMPHWVAELVVGAMYGWLYRLHTPRDLRTSRLAVPPSASTKKQPMATKHYLAVACRRTPTGPSSSRLSQARCLSRNDSPM
jgi:hypothetical protein